MSIEFNESNLKAITENSERAKSNTHRIEKCETEIKELQEAQKELYDINNNISQICIGLRYTNEKLDETTEDVKSVKQDVSNLKLAPEKNKAAIVDKVITILGTAITTGVIAFLLTQIAPAIFK